MKLVADTHTHARQRACLQHCVRKCIGGIERRVAFYVCDRPRADDAGCPSLLAFR